MQSDLLDGIVIADPAIFERMDEDILRAMDIYLDKNGEYSIKDLSDGKINYCKVN